MFWLKKFCSSAVSIRGVFLPPAFQADNVGAPVLKLAHAIHLKVNKIILQCYGREKAGTTIFAGNRSPWLNNYDTE